MHGQSKNSTLSDPKTNEDFNKQKPNHKDSNLYEYDPNTEVPIIGDDDKEITEVVTMNKTDKQNKDELNKKPASEKRIQERDSETKTEDSHS